MLLHRVYVFLSVFLMALCVAMPARADFESATQLVNELKTQINDDTDSEIAELYQDLTNALAEHQPTDNTSTVAATTTSNIDELKAHAQAMKERENSTANKLLGAAGIGAMGIGGMQTLSALAEQSADDAADQDMRAYLATFRCDYGAGRNIVGGETNIQLPGANDLIQYTTEYKQIAASLKADKEALGLLPGIESELVLDSATTGLYDDVSIGTQKGAFTSLSRALLDENSADAAELSQMYHDTLQKRQTGTALLVGGAVATIAGDLAINGINGPKTPDVDTDIEYEETKYDQMPPSERITAMEADLRNLISENERLMTEYNENLRQHQEFVATITIPVCREQFQNYINRIEELEPISDKLHQIPVIGYDLSDVTQKHNQCKTHRFVVADGNNTKGIPKEYKNVCNGTKKDTCIKVFNDVEVNMIQAVRIAKEYARVRDDKTITSCANEWDTRLNDDYVLCKTADNVYYTFQFDDVVESNSDKIRDHTARAICTGVYKGKYESASMLLNGSGLPKAATCEFKTDASKDKKLEISDTNFCDKLTDSLKYFHFLINKSTAVSGKCFVYFTPYRSRVGGQAKMVPVYGRQKYVEKHRYDNVDNYEFRKMGLQMRGDLEVVNMIKYWLSFKTGKDVSKISCNDGTTAYLGPDANGTGDDILACDVDGQRVDLVFDDFSEAFNDYTKQTLQAGVCMSNGAVYTGSRCIGASTGMTEAQCTDIINDVIEKCPKCSLPEWKDGACKTEENAAIVSFIDTYGPQIGVAIVSVALAFPTGGTSLTALEWFSLGTAVAGAAATSVSIKADLVIAAEVERFINNVSSKCVTTDCKVGTCSSDTDATKRGAECILNEYLVRMLNLSGDVSAVQANALDAELARLLKLLPLNKRKELGRQYKQGGSQWGTGIQCVKHIAQIVGYVASFASITSSIGSLSFSSTVKTLKDFAGLVDDAASLAL